MSSTAPNYGAPALNVASVGTSVIVGSHTIITNGSIEPPYYKGIDPNTGYFTRLQHIRTTDGSITTDSSAGWITPSLSFPGGWSVMDTLFSATSPFDSTTYHWNDGGAGWLDWGVAGGPPPDGPNAPLSLASMSEASFPLNSTLNVTANGGGKGETDQNTFGVKWHLPYEENEHLDTTYSKSALETRIANVQSGQFVAVQTTQAHEFNVSAFMDGVAVSGLSAGQIEVTGLAELIGKIADVIEWNTAIGPENSYTGAENGPDNWTLATTDNSEKYGGGNLPPANVPGSAANLSDGWQYCNMSIIEFAHVRTDSYFCDGYGSHGYDGDDERLCDVTQLDGGEGAVYDEPVFVQVRQINGTGKPPGGPPSGPPVYYPPSPGPPTNVPPVGPPPTFTIPTGPPPSSFLPNPS